MLHHYGKFLEKYNSEVTQFKEKLSNSYSIKSTPVVLEVMFF